ncbi:hypothetical protein [Aeropyrum camini]|uniref:hypothetical protein n=1 Tax=Aeropyrum camini TaxID=229980 RepID=UPI0007895D03|nr:hypothetical protein [Aeropyrum camini]
MWTFKTLESVAASSLPLPVVWKPRPAFSTSPSSDIISRRVLVEASPRPRSLASLCLPILSPSSRPRALAAW